MAKSGCAEDRRFWTLRRPASPASSAGRRAARRAPRARSGTVTRKVPRHPINSPRKLPSGAAMTSRERSAALEQGDGLRKVGPRSQARQNGRRERPEAADRDADQRPPGQEDEEVGGEGDGQARSDQHRRVEQDDRSPVELGQEAVAEEAGDHGEEPRHGDRQSGLAFRDGQVPGDGGEKAHRHELQPDQEKSEKREAGDRSPRGRRPIRPKARVSSVSPMAMLCSPVRCGTR